MVPRNYGRGPGLIMVNLRLSKTVAFGRAQESAVRPSGASSGGSGIRGIFNQDGTPRRYNLTISMAVRNILNHNNPGAITGNITSPLFGQANLPWGAADLGGGGFSESANNRRLELQIRFTF